MRYIIDTKTEDKNELIKRLKDLPDVQVHYAYNDGYASFIWGLEDLYAYFSDKELAKLTTEEKLEFIQCIQQEDAIADDASGHIDDLIPEFMHCVELNRKQKEELSKRESIQ